MRRYYVTCHYLSPDTGTMENMPITLGIADDGLHVTFPDRPDEFWPFTQVFAGQPAQGEAECLIPDAHPHMRIMVSPRLLSALKSAIKGQPYRLPPRYSMPAGYIVLFGFLFLCVLLWYLASR